MTKQEFFEEVRIRFQNNHLVTSWYIKYMSNEDIATEITSIAWEIMESQQNGK